MNYWVKKYFTDRKAHLAALAQVILTALFSIVPFYIFYCVKAALQQGDFFSSVEPIVERGQLYLLSYAIFGTVFWLAFVEGGRPRHNARIFLGIIAIFLLFPIFGFFGEDPTFSTILNPRIVTISYFFYGMILFINYLLLFYINVTPPEPTQTFEKEESDMRSRYQELKAHE